MRWLAFSSRLFCSPIPILLSRLLCSDLSPPHPARHASQACSAPHQCLSLSMDVACTDRHPIPLAPPASRHSPSMDTPPAPTCTRRQPPSSVLSLHVPISVSHRLHVFLSRGFHFSTTGEMGAARAHRASSPNPAAADLQCSAFSARPDALSSYRSHAEPDGVGGPRPGPADGRRD
jgi:hypothetical protein